MQQEANRLQQKRHQSFAVKQKQLTKVTRQIERIVMSIANGTDIPSMHDLLFKLEEQKQNLQNDLNSEPPKLPDLHPGLADIYRDRVANLEQALNDPNTVSKASEAIRALIDKIIITVSDQGDTEIALYGELDGLLHFMTSAETAEQRFPERRKPPLTK